jgi:hypothetical protein
VWSVETVFVCALTLLGRTQAGFPAVEFIETPPPGISRLAQGYSRYADARIVLVTSTSAFAAARRAMDRCGNVEAIREIAGVLAHEECHVRHRCDEASAYDTQLTALLLAGADQNSALYHKVMRAKQAVVGPSRRNVKASVLARNRPIAK